MAEPRTYVLATIKYGDSTAKFKIQRDSDSSAIRGAVCGRFDLPEDAPLILVDHEGCVVVLDANLDTGNYTLTMGGSGCKQALKESKGCCPPTRVPALENPGDYKKKGQIIKLGGGKLDMYVNGSPEGGKAVIVVADVFGMQSGRHYGIADQLASQGYLVVMPDLFHNKPIAFADIKTKIGEFLHTWPVEKWQPDMDLVWAYLKTKNVSKIGAIGFCWGSWAIFHESARGKPLNAGVCCHPSLVIEKLAFGKSVDELADRVKAPMLLLACQDDPEFVRPGGSVSKVLKKKPFGSDCQFTTVEQNHGFMSQGDVSKPQVKKDVAESLAKGEAFLKKLL